MSYLPSRLTAVIIWSYTKEQELKHYSDVIRRAMASQITSIAIVYLTVYSGIDQRKHQSSALPAFVVGIHRWPVNCPHKGPVKRKYFHLMTSPWGRKLGIVAYDSLWPVNETAPKNTRLKHESHYRIVMDTLKNGNMFKIDDQFTDKLWSYMLQT